MSLKSDSDARPIGVFDSGIGGLTVASALAKTLPNEQLIYFGDTVHLPYGEKSAAAIRTYATGIGKFFMEQNCKAVVIACNTASAVATLTMTKLLTAKIPVINVIDPTAKHVAEKYKKGKIGVIATKATVNSRIYAKRIEKKNPNLKVTMLATPLLVAMIEEGFFNNNISQAIINAYLEKSNLRNIQALILGCTHFPLIKNEVSSYYKGKTNVIDSSELVAEDTRKVLEKNNILHTGKPMAHQFYVSDLTPSFTESTRIFFGKKVKLSAVNLWD
ncbi:MAG TPA: glutamate racemase [Cryomorphaceae bacterium]|nr:glutamate racemase [Cryomorphaceae bacterium]